MRDGLDTWRTVTSTHARMYLSRYVDFAKFYACLVGCGRGPFKMRFQALGVQSDRPKSRIGVFVELQNYRIKIAKRTEKSKD